MELYGLDLKNDKDIENLTGGMKDQYDAAVALGAYIHTSKYEYKISVFEGEDDNELKQLLLVFKLKTTTKESSSDAENWPANKIDGEQDEFAFLHTIFKDKFVHGKFNVGKQTTTPDDFIVDFKTKEYQMLELFFAFKAVSPSKNDFATYNSASDDDNNSIAIATIKKYIVSLVTNDIKGTDLNGNIEVTINKTNASENIVPGTITFNYEDYSETKNIKFIYAENIDLKLNLVQNQK